MSKPKFHHVNLKTTRLAEMIDWYGKTIGMTVNHRAPVGAWLSNDEANHRIALVAFPWVCEDKARESHDGLHHTAFEFAAFAELFDNYARVREFGITPRLCLDHGLTTSMYYADPDGNYLELQVDNFGDWAKSTDWMRNSPEFAADPIGVFFDPARVYEAYRAGRTPAELHEAIVAGKFLPDPLPAIGPPAEAG